jgi:hypothetical protein
MKLYRLIYKREIIRKSGEVRAVKYQCSTQLFESSEEAEAWFYDEVKFDDKNLTAMLETKYSILGLEEVNV